MAQGAIFFNIIGQMESGRLMPAVQYAALNSLSRILETVPEGREVSCLIDSELEASVSKSRRAAEQARAEHSKYFGDGEVHRLGTSLERIDDVSPSLVKALKAAQPLLERAMRDSPGETAVLAFEQLRKIASLPGVQPTVPAVLDPATPDRARETTRPRAKSPAVRYLDDLIRPKQEDNRSLPVFTWKSGSVVHRNQWPEVLRLLSDHFGSEVTRESLSELFSLDRSDYRFGVVSIRFDDRGNLRIAAELCRRKEKAGYVGLLIPPIPPRGTLWAAKVEAIALIHKRLGLGSQLLARTARFLHAHGIHAMDADAMEDAGLFCVFNGFEVDRSIYEDVVDEFVEAMGRRGIKLEEDAVLTGLLNEHDNLGELASFEVGGKMVGREFLGQLFTRRYLPVRFPFGSDRRSQQSWLRLLSNLHRDRPDFRVVPMEWEHLQPATKGMLLSGLHFVGGNVAQILSSDGEHSHHLLERLTNWASSISMGLSYLRLYPDMPERMKRTTSDNIRPQAAAIQDVLEMIARDETSQLFSHFRLLLGPEKGAPVDGGFVMGHGVSIGDTLLAAERHGFLALPAVLRALFEEKVSQE
jgi:GNAT superfamily N-acetyltransferase